MTLVEILVGLVMMGIIVTGIYNLFRVHNLMAAKQEETTKMQQELLSALVDMSEELRMCGFSASGGGNYGFIALDGDRGTNATSIYCTRGLSQLNNSTRDIAYTRNASNNDLLVFDTNLGWVTAANNISDLRFRYFDINGDETATMSQIRMIEINATAIASPERTALRIKNRNMHTRVWMRNLGIN